MYIAGTNLYTRNAEQHTDYRRKPPNILCICRGSSMIYIIFLDTHFVGTPLPYCPFAEYNTCSLYRCIKRVRRDKCKCRLCFSSRTPDVTAAAILRVSNAADCKTKRSPHVLSAS